MAAIFSDEAPAKLNGSRVIFPCDGGEPSRGAQVYPGGLWEDWRRADGENGTGLAAPSAAFMAESPLRKRAGKRKMRSSPRRWQSPYLAVVGSFKSSRVKHLRGSPPFLKQAGAGKRPRERLLWTITAVMSWEEMEIPM